VSGCSTRLQVLPAARGAAAPEIVASNNSSGREGHRVPQSLDVIPYSITRPSIDQGVSVDAKNLGCYSSLLEEN